MTVGWARGQKASIAGLREKRERKGKKRRLRFVVRSKWCTARGKPTGPEVNPMGIRKGEGHTAYITQL